MPDETIRIGGREYEVACQPGEEEFLQSAAAMLDAEATTLAGQIGRLPEPRMLLMAGLMLADKTAGLDEKLREREARVAALEAEVKSLRDMPGPTPERVEVPVIPGPVLETLAELAARSEALADAVEDRAAV